MAENANKDKQEKVSELESKIVKRELLNLEQEVTSAADSFKEKIRLIMQRYDKGLSSPITAVTAVIGPGEKETRSFYITDILDSLKKGILRSLETQAREKAIDDFLEEIEELRAGLNDLENRINY